MAHLVPAPAEFEVQKGALLTPSFQWGSGATYHQCGVGILSHKKVASATGMRWELEGSRRVLLGRKMFELFSSR